MSDNATTYPPLDVLKPVAERLWIVDSGPLRVLGMPLPIRMTAIRLGSGEVWLHSPTQYDNHLRREIEQAGPIRHLVAPNVGHWSFLTAWQRHCPNALTWAAPGLRTRSQVRKSGVRLDHDLSSIAPTAWAGDIDQVIVPGAAGFREVAFFHQRTRTLVLTDLIVNLEAEKLPLVMRPAVRLVGGLAPNGKAPIYLRVLIWARRRESEPAALRMLSWAPERVIFGHGRWFDRDGTAALKRSFDWLLA